MTEESAAISEMGIAPLDSMDSTALEPRFIKANNLEFGYLEMGEGPLVLCLHGFADTAWSYEPVLRQLAATGFRAVAPFQRGYAPSQIPARGDCSLPILARDVLALIEHFGQNRAAIVGQGWGAMAAYLAAIMRPDRVRRVVAAGMPHPRRLLLRPSFRQLRRSRYLLEFEIPQLAERRLANNDFAGLEKLIRRWSPGWQFTSDDIADVKSAYAEPQRLTAALSWYRGIPRSSIDIDGWRSLMKPVPVPTRVLAGTDDGCVGLEMFEGQAHLFSAGYDLLTIPGAGHFLHRERPEEFADRVLEFLVT